MSTLRTCTGTLTALLVMAGCTSGPNIAGIQSGAAQRSDWEHARPPREARRLDGGIAYVVLTPGTGETHPGPDSHVSIEFVGYTGDGRVFDSSARKGKPQVYGLRDVVLGLSRALQEMTVGEKARFWIPADLAYGDTPEDPRMPAGPVVFEIELLKILR